jgi:predicted small metal-binding protein
MTDKRPKLSTCPICGYTDTSEDAEALNSAIEEHIRLAHNLDPATLGGSDNVKQVTTDVANEVGANYATTSLATPIVSVAANSGGTGAAPTVPNAVYVAGLAPDDTTFNNPDARDRNEHRNDEMDNFS